MKRFPAQSAVFCFKGHVNFRFEIFENILYACQALDDIGFNRWVVGEFFCQQYTILWNVCKGFEGICFYFRAANSVWLNAHDKYFWFSEYDLLSVMGNRI